MDATIREATHEDVPGIASWTADTFAWGDYVAEELPDWIEDPSGRVLVADIDGSVAAMGRVAMVTPSEAWAQGARVHPDHRRQGLGSLLSSHLWAWARSKGARIVRLAVEDDNTAAHGQVTAMGFRRISDWVFATRRLGSRSPVMEGNGGRRVAAPERLQPAHSAEAEPAFLSWSAGDLSAAAGGLLPIGWVWRLMTLDHVTLAARSHALWEARPGWVMAEVDDAALHVHWLETTDADAPALIRALVDLALEREAQSLRIMVPAVPWLTEALDAADFDHFPLGVYGMGL